MTEIASLESEQEIIKILLNEPELIDDVRIDLKPNDFYIIKYKKVFERLLELREKGILPDTATIRKINTEEQEVDFTDIDSFFNTSYEVLKLNSYINHILECAEIRYFEKLPLLVQDIKDNPNFNMDQKKNYLLNKFSNFVIKGKSNTDFSIRSAIEQTRQKYKNYKDGVEGIKTYIPELDPYTLGFESGELVVIAGRPGTGKSLVACQIALNMAMSGIGTAIVSYEMDRTQLVTRFVTSLAKINNINMKKGNLSIDQEAYVQHALDVIETLPILIIDDSSTDINMIKSIVSKSSFKVDAILVDYLQLMPLIKNTGNTVKDIGQLSNGLKKLASKNELDATVFALSQMSRNIESRSDGKPKLSDLRDSGEIEQDADRVFFLKRVSNNELAVFISKQRNLPALQEPIIVPTYFDIQKFGSQEFQI